MSWYTYLSGGEEDRLLSTRTSVAHKPYKCDDCGLTIETGIRYYQVAYISGQDGKFHFRRSHSPNGECIDLLEASLDPQA